MLLFVPNVASIAVQDADEIAGIVSQAAAADGETPFELPLIDRLARLVPADRAGYYEYDVPIARPPKSANRFDVKQAGPPEPDWWSEEVLGVLPYYPLFDVQSQRTGVACFSDRFTPKQRKRNPFYRLVMRPSGFDDELKLWLPAGPGTVRAFFFVRATGRPDFDERDRAVLSVLRLHLGEIRQRWERRHRPPGLTAREIEVLHLLRDGLTNKEIARQLLISQGTVRTHLENIFAKLNVHTRAAAIAVCLGG